jgi:multidrug efflux pump subunit AcrB
VLDASTERIRPILLTTITTVGGMIPLTFVSEMWAPLAFTIAFGLLYGTLLTLVLIPLLSYRYELKHRP